MIFDKDLLALGIGMTASHRNFANVMVNDGNVIISNGDNTFIISYQDETIKGKEMSFSVADYPDDAKSVIVDKDNIMFITTKGNIKKVITIKQTENNYDKFKQIINIIDNVKLDTFIDKQLIDLLDDEISFFRLKYDKGNILLNQFHGYSGKMMMIRKNVTEGIDAFFGEEDNKQFEIGTITDIWKFVYNNLDNIALHIIPGSYILGMGTRKNTHVKFAISDAEWTDE